MASCQGSGDTVLCDGLTYPGFIAAARQLGLRVVGLDMDEEGTTTDALQLACQRYRPRAVYLMPRLNNPTCRQMSRLRMEHLAELCRQHRGHIIEDDVQGRLTDTRHPSFTNVAADITTLISSCSKALAGGLRVGFIYPTRATLELVENALRASCWMIAPLAAEVVCRWIMSQWAERMIREQHEELAVRHQMVAEAFRDYRFEAVTSALNVWLHLPEHWRAAAFTEHVADEGVLLKPAEVFAVGQYPAPQAVRLCVGGETTRSQLGEGLAQLKRLLEEVPACDQPFD